MKNTSTSAPETIKPSSGYQFSTFKGVFTPSILTILGVIMYLRMGWVLGNVGLSLTLLIVTISTSITFLTGLSLSSLATNMKVKGGGAYFIISRSLGIEAGAAIGLPLFLAQALSISFYISGFTESLVAIWPNVNEITVGIITLVLITFVAYRSADLALKLQFVIMILIGISLVSLFLGTEPSGSVPTENLNRVVATASFWQVFAVFFPAVTGILAGIAMSGDLKNPAKSLPIGTISAVILGYIIYMIIPIFLNDIVKDKTLLLEQPFIVKDIAKWQSFILLGLWGAALSSALGSILGAPRTLQALALDGIIPRIFGRSYGEGNDPRIATILTFILAFCGVVLGDLNLIAPVLSMFFLTSYGLLNLSAGFEELIASPSWRPTFKVSWKLNFFAAFLCFGAMFMINPGATFIAAAISLAVYYYMEKRTLVAHWGDVRYGILTLIVQYALRQLSGKAPDEKTWKPNILVLSGSPTTRWHLIALANALSENRSLMTVATVLPGKNIPPERARTVTQSINDYLKRQEVRAMVKVIRAENVVSGLQSLIQAYGFGPLTPNTILMGESEAEEQVGNYVSLVEQICQTERNLIIVRGGKEPPVLDEGSHIDIWWSRHSKNLGLMLALAHQLQRSSGWQKAALVIKTIVPQDSEETEQLAKSQLEEFIKRERLNATVEVRVAKDSDTFGLIADSSKDASLVFLGFRPPAVDETLESFTNYYQNLINDTLSFPPTAFVYAAQDLQFRQIFSS